MPNDKSKLFEKVQPNQQQKKEVIPGRKPGLVGGGPGPSFAERQYMQQPPEGDNQPSNSSDTGKGKEVVDKRGVIHHRVTPDTRSIPYPQRNIGASLEELLEASKKNPWTGESHDKEPISTEKGVQIDTNSSTPPVQTDHSTQSLAKSMQGMFSQEELHYLLGIPQGTNNEQTTIVNAAQPIDANSQNIQPSGLDMTTLSAEDLNTLFESFVKIPTEESEEDIHANSSTLQKTQPPGLDMAALSAEDLNTLFGPCVSEFRERSNTNNSDVSTTAIQERSQEVLGQTRSDFTDAIQSLNNLGLVRADSSKKSISHSPDVNPDNLKNTIQNDLDKDIKARKAIFG